MWVGYPVQELTHLPISSAVEIVEAEIVGLLSRERKVAGLMADYQTSRERKETEHVNVSQIGSPLLVVNKTTFKGVGNRYISKNRHKKCESSNESNEMEIIHPLLISESDLIDIGTPHTSILNKGGRQKSTPKEKVKAGSMKKLRRQLFNFKNKYVSKAYFDENLVEEEESMD